MQIETFEDLFENMLRDVYDAEKQHSKVLTKMAKMAAHDGLRQAIDKHFEETQRQVERLEQIFEILEMKGKGQKCEATRGLIEEAQEIMSEVEEAPVRDAGLIAAAQALEHYEIARYGTLVAWAQKLGEREVVGLLHDSLREEHNTNQLLNQLAEQTINDQALHAEEEMEVNADRQDRDEDSEAEEDRPAPRGSKRRETPKRRSAQRPSAAARAQAARVGSSQTRSSASGQARGGRRSGSRGGKARKK